VDTRKLFINLYYLFCLHQLFEIKINILIFFSNKKCLYYKLYFLFYYFLIFVLLQFLRIMEATMLNFSEKRRQISNAKVVTIYLPLILALIHQGLNEIMEKNGFVYFNYFKNTLARMVWLGFHIFRWVSGSLGGFVVLHVGLMGLPYLFEDFYISYFHSYYRTDSLIFIRSFRHACHSSFSAQHFIQL